MCHTTITQRLARTVAGRQGGSRGRGGSTACSGWGGQQSFFLFFVVVIREAVQVDICAHCVLLLFILLPVALHGVSVGVIVLVCLVVIDDDDEDVIVINNDNWGVS